MQFSINHTLSSHSTTYTHTHTQSIFSAENQRQQQETKSEKEKFNTTYHYIQYINVNKLFQIMCVYMPTFSRIVISLVYPLSLLALKVSFHYSNNNKNKSHTRHTLNGYNIVCSFLFNQKEIFSACLYRNLTLDYASQSC